MARYTLRYNELADLEHNQLEREFERLELWLHETGIDPEFDRDQHIYRDGVTGNRWIFLPELTEKQLFAAELIVSSSELYFDDKPLHRGPVVEDAQDD